MKPSQFHAVLVDYATQLADYAADVVVMARAATDLDDVAEQNVLFAINNAHAHLVNAKTRLASNEQPPFVAA